MPSINDMRLAGVWNLTGNWNEPPPGASIMSGSTVNVSGSLDSGYNLVINENATLNVAEVRTPFGASPKNRFLYKNAGTLNVTGEMLDTIQSAASTAYSLACFFARGNANAVTRTKGLIHNGSTKGAHVFLLNNSEDSVTNTFVLGSSGLSFRDNLRSNSSCYPYFPSDYDNRTVPHTVHVLNRIGAGGSVTVKGCGKMAFEHSSDFLGTLTVQDTATVSVKVGCGFTRSGDATVSSGAAIEVAQSGSVTFGKNLTLADGAILGFNFTDKTPPVLNMSGKTVTLNDQKNIVVKITAAEGKSAKGGAYNLTAGGKFAGANVTLAEGAPKWAKRVRVDNNEIVLDVITLGTYIFVR